MPTMADWSSRPSSGPRRLLQRGPGGGRFAVVPRQPLAAGAAWVATVAIAAAAAAAATSTGDFDGAESDTSEITTAACRTTQSVAATATASRRADRSSVQWRPQCHHPAGPSSVMATSASVTNSTGSFEGRRQLGSRDAGTAAAATTKDAPTTVVEYDFVVVGNGNAGSSAVRTLRRLCPDASVAVIDPNLNLNLAASSGGGGGNSNDDDERTAYLPHAAVGLDHANRTIRMTDGRALKFRQSALLATGSRGSPPPSSLVDVGAMGRVLELRSTEAPLTTGGASVSDGRGSRAVVRRPVMPPEGVRQLTIVAAGQGGKVCVLGSGVDAVELAAAAAAAAAESDHNNSANGGNNNQNSDIGRSGGGVNASVKGRKRRKKKDNDGELPRVTLTFGSPGPLSSRLPRYLSTAVARRLRQHGIDVQERTLVRYVAMDHHGSGLQQLGGSLEVHTARSYDTMDTRRTEADLLVVAPAVEGQLGTAVVPVAPNLIQSSLEEDASVGGGAPSPSTTPVFDSWSNLSPAGEHSALTCYVDDGRVAVNAELHAASGVYAAGSVARYPNFATGHATVAGEGGVDARVAGDVAAHNMVREFHGRSSSAGSVQAGVGRLVGPFERRSAAAAAAATLSKSRLFSAESVPIWRTDVRSYATHGTAGGRGGGTTAESASPLSSLGIHALCIGNCTSETMATHGFWWTNQSSDSKKKRDALSILRGGQRDDGLARRRSTKRSSTVRRSVYGSGVVYYLDRSGSISGVMVWGLPFCYKDTGDLNESLVGRMKQLIHTNGEIAKAQHGKAVLERDGRLDTSKLSSYHLSEESKLLASIALSLGSQSDPANKVGSIAHPLHRYLPSKPASITSIGMLKRRDVIGTGGAGEDIFARTARSDENEGDSPHSLVHVYPMQWGSGSEGANVFSYATHDEAISGDQSRVERLASTNGNDGNDAPDYERLRKAERENGIRSRPPKEEPLWMREGDASRTISMNDVLSDVFLLNVRHGRFHDGSDAVKQAPVPKMVANAKKILEWTSGDKDDLEEAEGDGVGGER